MVNVYCHKTECKFNISQYCNAYFITLDESGECIL